MLEAKEKEIDGIQFRYTPMMATPARNLLVELLNKFGPAMAAAVEGMEKIEDVDMDVKVEELIGSLTHSVGGSIREVSHNLTPGFYNKLVENCRKQTQYLMGEMEGFAILKKDAAEMLFGTKLLTEAKWIGFCLEVQFSDFFAPLKTGALRALAFRAIKQGSSSDSPKKSTGTSKESPQAKE